MTFLALSCQVINSIVFCSTLSSDNFEVTLNKSKVDVMQEVKYYPAKSQDLRDMVDALDNIEKLTSKVGCRVTANGKNFYSSAKCSELRKK